MTPAAIFTNHVLAQQPWAREALARHAGRSLRIAAPPFALGFKITAAGDLESTQPWPIGNTGAAPGPAAAPDVTLSIAATRVPLLFIDPETAMKDVHIEGDAEFAQTLARLAREVRWDVEEDLSKLVGDIPAHQFMRFARAFAAWGREAGKRFGETTAAFLLDEDPTLVRKGAVDQFSRDVATLRDDCERLEKRLQLLKAKPR